MRAHAYWCFFLVLGTHLPSLEFGCPLHRPPDTASWDNLEIMRARELLCRMCARTHTWVDMYSTRSTSHWRVWNRS
jgi:hypothetical protein